METETVHVSQGSQPSYAGVRVGVQLVGQHEGLRKARLMIRSSSESKRVDLAEGDSEDLFGVGSVTLDAAAPDETADAATGLGDVTLTFRGPRA